MKEENKKYLEKYKLDLYRAWKYDYSTNLPISILLNLEKIYFDETGTAVNLNFSCSYCILRLLSSLGDLYFTSFPDEIPRKNKKIKK